MSLAKEWLAGLLIAGLLMGCTDSDNNDGTRPAELLAAKIGVQNAVVRPDADLLPASPLPNRPQVVAANPNIVTDKGLNTTVPLALVVDDNSSLVRMLFKIVGAERMHEIDLSSANPQRKLVLPFNLNLQLGADITEASFCADLQLIDSTGRVSDPYRICFALLSNQAGSTPLIANAGGATTVISGAAATLTGSAAGGTGTPLSFSWRQLSGPNLLLQGVNTPTVSFSAPLLSQAESARLELRVTDPQQQVAIDVVEVRIVPLPPGNAAPLVEAGSPQTAFAGTSIALSGDAVDLDGVISSVLWQQISGTPGTISNPNSLQTSFSSGASDETVLQLIVTDDDGAVGQDTLTLRIEAATGPTPGAPSADAGPAQLTVVSGSAVQLDGGGSQVGQGQQAQFRWLQIAGPTVTLFGADTARPSFNAPEVGASTTLSFRLTLTDTTGASDTDTIDVVVTPPQLVAAAGPDRVVDTGAVVILDGSASSSNLGAITQFRWRQTAGPQVNLRNANTARARFTAPSTNATQLRFELTVTDRAGSTATDALLISVLVPPQANRLPVANAGPDQTVSPDAPVTLNATGSFDPDGGALAFTWRQTGGPFVALSGVTTARASFTAPTVSEVTDMTFSVEVSDDQAATAVDEVRIVVDPQNSTGPTPTPTPTATPTPTPTPTPAPAGFQQLIGVVGPGLVRGGSCQLSGLQTGTIYDSATIDNSSRCTLSAANGTTELLLLRYTGGEFFSPASDSFISWPAGRELSGVTAPPADNGSVTVAISTLTELVVSQLLALPASQRTASELQAALELIGGQFLPDTGINLGTALPGIISDLSGTGIDDIYTLVLAGLDQLADDAGNAGATIFDLLDVLTQDAQDGFFGDDGGVFYEDLVEFDSLLDTALDTQAQARGTAGIQSSIQDLINATRDPDGGGDGGPSNQAPVANAGPDQQVPLGTTINLNGSNSSDPDGDTLGFLWSVQSAPQGATADIGNPAGAQTTLTVDMTGSYTLNLRVSDGSLSADDQVTINVTAPPSDSDFFSFEYDQTRVYAGGRLGFQITVGNTGSSDLRDLVMLVPVANGVSFDFVSDAEPPGLSGTGCDSGNFCNSGVVRWDLGTLNPGESLSIDINAGLFGGLTPGDMLSTTVSFSSTSLNDTVEITRTATVIADDSVDFHLSSSHDAIVPGQTYRYTLDLGNASGSVKQNTVTSLTLPAGVSVLSISDAGNQAGQTVVWPAASVLPGELVRREVEVQLSTLSSEAQTLVAAARLSYDGGPSIDREVFTPTSVSSPLPLAVDYRLSSTEVQANGRLDYQFTVSNTSTTDVISNVRVLSRVPAGLGYDVQSDAEPDGNLAPGTRCDSGLFCGAHDEGLWFLGTFPPGRSVTINIHARVDGTVDPGDLIESPFYVTADGLDDTLLLHRTARVIGAQELNLALTASGDAVAPDASYRYQLDVGNSTTTTRNDGALTLELPTGITATAISDGGTQSGRLVSWDLGTLLPGSLLRRHVDLNVPSTAVSGDILGATARLRRDGGNALDREAQAVVTVATVSPLSVDFSLGSSETAASGMLNYQLTLSNEHDSNVLSGVRAALRVPLGVEFDLESDAQPDAVPGQGNRCDSSNLCRAYDEAFWDVGTLAAGQSVTIDVGAMVTAGVSGGELIETAVLISEDSSDDLILLRRTARVVDALDFDLSLTASTDPVTAGSAFSYQLDVSNASTSTSSNSELLLIVPDGISISSASDGGVISGQRVSWALGNITPARALRRSVEVLPGSALINGQTLTAVAQLHHLGGAEFDREVHTPVTVADALDLQLHYSLASSEVRPSGRLGYQITVGNSSSTDFLDDVEVIVRVPDGVFFDLESDAERDGGAAPGNECDSGNRCFVGDEGLWDLGTLAPGDSATIDLSAGVESSVDTGRLIETAVHVTSSSIKDVLLLHRTARVQASEEVFLSARTDAEPVAPGSSFSYFLDVGNASSGTLGNTTLELLLPSTVSVNSISDGGTQTGDIISWNLGDVGLETALQRSVNVSLSSNAVDGQNLAATARLRHDGGWELDREVVIPLSVSPAGSLNVSFTQPSSPVMAGGTLPYQIVLQNTSTTDTVDNVRVALRVPFGISFDLIDDANPPGTTGPGNRCNSGNVCAEDAEAFWDIGSVGAGQTVTIDVNAAVSGGPQPGRLIETPITVTADGLGDTVLQHRIVPVAP